MTNHSARFDAPFWALLIAGFVLVGSLGCFGLAAAAQNASHTTASIVSVD